MTKILFHREHAWIRRDGAEASVGVSDYAQTALGPVVFAELPQPGEKLVHDTPCGVLESAKTASDIIAPASGRVIRVNETVIDRPGLINEAAEEAGWLFTMTLDDPDQLAGLMEPDAYRRFTD